MFQVSIFNHPVQRNCSSMNFECEEEKNLIKHKLRRWSFEWMQVKILGLSFHSDLFLLHYPLPSGSSSFGWRSRSEPFDLRLAGGGGNIISREDATTRRRSVSGVAFTLSYVSLLVLFGLRKWWIYGFYCGLELLLLCFTIIDFCLEINKRSGKGKYQGIEKFMKELNWPGGDNCLRSW